MKLTILITFLLFYCQHILVLILNIQQGAQFFLGGEILLLQFPVNKASIILFYFYVSLVIYSCALNLNFNKNKISLKMLSIGRGCGKW